MNIPLVDPSKQYRELKPQIDRAVNRVLRKGNFILGDEVDEFERDFARYCGTKYCIGVSSGSSALLIALQSLGVGQGDEVITTPNTFIATVFPIIFLGAKPIFVDIDPKTYQIDISRLEKAMTPKTKVIVPVHLFGIPAPMDGIMRIARRCGIYVVEDACQAHGSSLNGRKCGSFGDVAAFSFYPGKNLGAAGDGGALITNNKELADKIRAMRNVGQSEKYKHDIFGYNSRLDTIHAVILSLKLKKLNRWNAKRRNIARLYNKFLKDLPIILPPKLKKNYVENYHLYVIRLPERNNLLAFLKEKGVHCGIHYPIPVHLQKSLKQLNYKKGDFPIAEKYADEILSLPMHPHLTLKEIEYICSLIKRFFAEQK